MSADARRSTSTLCLVFGPLFIAGGYLAAFTPDGGIYIFIGLGALFGVPRRRDGIAYAEYVAGKGQPVMRRVGIALALLLVLAASVGAGAFLGQSVALGMTVVELTALGLAIFLPWRQWVRYSALGCASLGAAIGIVGAIQAFMAVGGHAEYVARVPFGVAALVLAMLAGLGGFVALRHPVRGASLTVVAGLAGVVAMNLYYLNTVYNFAIPCWFLSVLLFFGQCVRPDGTVGSQATPTHGP